MQRSMVTPLADVPSVAPDPHALAQMHLRLAGVEVLVQEYDGARRSPSGACVPRSIVRAKLTRPRRRVTALAVGGGGCRRMHALPKAPPCHTVSAACTLGSRAAGGRAGQRRQRRARCPSRAASPARTPREPRAAQRQRPASGVRAAGQLPALERGDDLVEGGSDEDSCAQAIAGYLAEHGHDLDAHLGATERSELAAFRRVRGH